MNDLGYWLALIFITIACYTDVSSFKIPNKLSILPYSSGMAILLLAGDYKKMLASALICMVVFSLLFTLYLAKGLGAGDVKFISGLSFLFSGDKLFLLIMYSFLFAGCIAVAIYIIKLIVKANKSLRLSRLGLIAKLKHIPFMVTVFIASVTDLIYEVFK